MGKLETRLAPSFFWAGIVGAFFSVAWAVAIISMRRMGWELGVTLGALTVLSLMLLISYQRERLTLSNEGIERRTLTGRFRMALCEIERVESDEQAYSLVFRGAHKTMVVHGPGMYERASCEPLFEAILAYLEAHDVLVYPRPSAPFARMVGTRIR